MKKGRGSPPARFCRSLLAELLDVGGVLLGLLAALDAVLDLKEVGGGDDSLGAAVAPQNHSRATACGTSSPRPARRAPLRERELLAAPLSGPRGTTGWGKGVWPVTRSRNSASDIPDAPHVDVDLEHGVWLRGFFDKLNVELFANQFPR